MQIDSNPPSLSSNAHADGGDADSGDVISKYHEATSYYLPWYRKLSELTTLFRGYQYSNFRRTPAGVDRTLVEVAPTRVRFTHNIIFKAWMTTVSRLRNVTPEFYVRPLTSDADDERKARLAEDAIRYVERQNDGRKLRDKLTGRIALYGAGVRKVYWNPEKKASVLGDDGPVEQEVGDVVCEVLRPDELIIDHNATEFEDASWIIHRAVMSSREVEIRYGVKVKEKDVTVSPANWVLTSGMSGRTHTRRGVEILEYWEKPSDDHPNGRYMVVANDQNIPLGKVKCDAEVEVDEDGVEVECDCEICKREESVTEIDLPYYEDTGGRVVFPFVFYTQAEAFADPTGVGAMEQIIPHQSAVNRLLSERLEHTLAQMHPMLAVEGGVAKFKKSKETGQQIHHARGTSAPHYIPSPSVSGDTVELQDRLETGAQNLVGSADITESARNGGVKTGRAQMAQQQLNLERAASISNAIEIGDRTYFHYVLELMKAYVPDGDKRLVDLGGGEVGATSFGGMQINTTDVEVVPGSARPRDPWAEWNVLAEARQYDVIAPEQARDIFFTLGLIPTMEQPADYVTANAENSAMKRGEQMVVSIEDEHETHLRLHREFYESRRYTFDTETKKQFHWHMKAHAKAMSGAQPTVQDEPPLFKPEDGEENPLWREFMLDHELEQETAPMAMSESQPLTPDETGVM